MSGSNRLPAAMKSSLRRFSSRFAGFANSEISKDSDLPSVRSGLELRLRPGRHVDEVGFRNFTCPPVLLACLMLFLGVEMKGIAMVLLVGLAVAYYFGYDPSDLIPSIPTNNAPPHRARQAAAPVEETQNATPARSVTSTAVAGAQDGSLDNRWKP